MDNPENLATLGTQDTGRRQTKQINVRENRRGNQEWTIQRTWQHWVPIFCFSDGVLLSILLMTNQQVIQDLKHKIPKSETVVLYLQMTRGLFHNFHHYFLHKIPITHKI